MKFASSVLLFNNLGKSINKYFAFYFIANGDASSDRLAQLSLEFRVFLVSAQTGKHTQESRTLRFWFAEGLNDKGTEQAHVAQEFFRELVSPQEFPRGSQIFYIKLILLLCDIYLNKLN